MKQRMTGKMTALLLLILFVTAACGGNNNEPSGAANNETENASTGETAQQENQEDADQAEEPATKIYKNVYGDTEIPAHPQRIVSDWYYGDMVALGVKPVGLTSFVLNNHPYIKPEGTSDVGNLINLEATAALEPDLIILYGNNDKHEEFEKIAPTIGVEIQPNPINAVRIFGEILGKEAEAEQWIVDYEAKIEAAKSKIAGKVAEDETFTIFNVWKDGLRVYGNINMGGYILYDELGIQPQERVLNDIINGKEINAGTEISMEEIASFAGDNIILTSYQGDELKGQMLESEVWKGLDAVKNSKVYEIDYNLLYNEDPVAMMNQVEVLTDLILENR